MIAEVQKSLANYPFANLELAFEFSFANFGIWFHFLASEDTWHKMVQISWRQGCRVQLNPVKILTPCLLRMNFSIILLSVSWSPKWSTPFRLFD